ncbi:protein Ycf68 [Exiguobacterium sp. ZOR0005]|uniref:protein Ycf68 n=1 Tax=Exiguobacterium sp. ZOR0005 TaxID=1339226 RepID=UPI001E4D1B25|nr:protein Ycf68 [Exiguobacterium sp. ZOR0005]
MGATRVAHPVKEKRTFFVLALTGRTGTGPPAPFHSTHVTSLFHADVRLVRTEDEMVGR